MALEELWIRSVCTTRLSSPSVSGPRSLGHSPEIAHCQIRSRFSSSVGTPPPSCPGLGLPSLLLPAALPCRVPGPAGALVDNQLRRGKRLSVPSSADQGDC